MGTEQDLRRIAQLATQAANMAAQGNAGLAPLLQEMQALSEVLPGVRSQGPIERIGPDGDIEADFDNMPV